MKIYVQLGEAPIPVDERVGYRKGFRDFVKAQLDSSQTRIILVEPNLDLVPKLQELWSFSSNVEISNAHISFDPGPSATRFFSGASGNNFPEVFAQDEEYVRRYFPSGVLTTSDVATQNFERWVEELSNGSRIAALSIDLRRSDIRDFEFVAWGKVPIETLILTTDGISDDQLARLRTVLKAAGFHRAGRSWGEAKTGETFHKSTSTKERFKSSISQAKVSAGEVAVLAAQALPNDERRSAMKDRLRVAVSRSYSKADVLDSTFGRTLQPVDVREVDQAIRDVSHASGREITVLADSEKSINQVAELCFATHGVWPISFSYPKEPLPLAPNPQRDLCSITPGFPYSFDDEGEYLRTYADARLGLTHRKAGWDCFRHLEIMASGAAPLMLDASEIPKYSMIHYPKYALTEVARAIGQGNGIPDLATRESLREYFTAHLTSKAMASYILKMSGLADVKRVLFVDEQLPTHADYQSTLTLIGLKQILGVNCEVAYPVDYLYADTAVDVSKLYGRGFGYTRILTSKMRSENERRPSIRGIGEFELESFDAVIVGSIARNHPLAQKLIGEFPAKRTVWIHGEDGPPSIEEAKSLRATGARVFVRAISN